MARPSKRLAISGQRFLTLRMERAISHGDIHADDHSPRAQSVSTMVGAVLAAVALAGSAVLGMWRPSSEWGSASVVTVRDTGELYVRVDDVIHPVLNLTSARLIAGTGDAPRAVAQAAVEHTKHGAMMGIPGAPTLTGTTLAEQDSVWTVCDAESTTVIAGPPGSTESPAHQAILVTGPSGTVYLLYNGRRARVAVQDLAVSRVLGAENIRPATVSRALLEMVPEAPPIVAPQIPGAGNPGPVALPGFVIGDVVQVRQATGTEFLVVLSGGVQRVSRFTADLIRSGGRGAGVTAVAPAVANGLPRLGTLAVETFPDHIDTVLGADAGVVCASWRAGVTRILVGGQPLNSLQLPTRLAQADGGGPLADEVYLLDGRPAYVRADGAPTATGSLVTRHGVRFPVGDQESARILGLPATAMAVPRAVLDALPQGPTLSRSAAMTAYDAVAPGSR